MLGLLRNGALHLSVVLLCGGAASWFMEPAQAQVVSLDLLDRLREVELRSSATDRVVGGLTSTLGGLRSDVDTLRASLVNLPSLGTIDPSNAADLANLVATINRQGAAIDLTSRELESLKLRVGTGTGSNGGGEADNDHDARLRLHQQRLDQQDQANTGQDDQLDDHEARMDRQEQLGSAHAQRLDDHGDRLDDHETRLNDHDRQLALTARAMQAMQADVTNQLADVRDELRDHDRRIDEATEGVAMALAMKSPTVPDDKDFALSGSFGAFGGRTALAVAGGVRASQALQFDAGIAVGLDGGSVGGRAGATLAW